MGRKGSPGRSFAVLGRGGSPVTRARLCTFLAVGFVLGLSLGFVFMGTVHAVRAWGHGTSAGKQPHVCRRCCRCPQVPPAHLLNR